MKPIAITGYSVMNALGDTREAVAAALREGRSGLSPVRFPLPFQTDTGAIDTVLPELPASLADWETRTAKISQHLLAQMRPELEALMERWDPSRVAILLGTSTAGADKTEVAYQHFVKHGALPEDYELWKHHTYGATLHVVRELTGATGPAWMISTACTSSAKPLGSAARLIEAGIIDAAIVGGVDTLCSMTLQGFHALSALSTERTKPFSKDRRGINIGEGGAFILLEREGPAKAWLMGVGESSDAYHLAAPHPEGAGAALAMQRALEQANIDPAAVDFINAHGTGTGLNDAAESKAIAEIFPPQTPVFSTKGFTGHTLGGAGATEVVFCLLSLEGGWIPPSLYAAPLDERLPVRVTMAAEEGAYQYALSNSFAFGGNNISVLLRAGGDHA